MDDVPTVILRKTSLVDYPGRLAGVLFFPGCNLRCPWCQNRGLVLGERTGETGENLISLDDALDHIARRKKVLGGVVLSGGEPLLYPQLGKIVNDIHDLGLRVKIDTNGMNPPALHELCKKETTKPDFIALDLKLAPERYAELLPGNGAGPAGQNPACRDPAKALAESAGLIRSSGITHEYRSLALPNNYFSVKDVEALCPLVDDSPWYFRSFVPGNCLDSSWDDFEKPAPNAAKLLADRARELGKNGVGR
ncbi:MAG: radical SAM protein [Treponema sp.]|jgi:pyruvate formate lyase activating enzyme|nr:radical SAM protein [Treponema sp.]